MKSMPYLLSLVFAVATSSILLGQQRANTDEIEREESKTALNRADLPADARTNDDLLLNIRLRVFIV